MKSFISKGLLLVVLIAGIALHATAQSTSVQLIVTTTDGEQQTYSLTEESHMYFTDGTYLVIEDGAGSSESFDLAKIRNITCAEVTGVDDLASASVQIFPNPSHNNFIIRNLQGNCKARVYTLDGRLVKSFEASDGMTVDISYMSNGMYLLHVDGKTLKLMKL